MRKRVNLLTLSSVQNILKNRATRIFGAKCGLELKTLNIQRIRLLTKNPAHQKERF